MPLNGWGAVSKQIEPGQIVQLKSGGPKMTAESIFNDGRGKRCVKCVWFQENKLIREIFRIEAVELDRGGA